MSFSRTKVNQDDLEEEFFLHSLSSHLQLVLGMLQASPTLTTVHKLVWRVETVIIVTTLVTLVLSINRFDKHGRVSGWLAGMFSCFNFLHNLYSEGSSHSHEETEWSELSDHSHSFSMQGRRDANEDRAVIRRVKTVEGVEENDGDAVHIWAVMDGHGGDFCADYTAKHLLPSLEKSVQKLKILTSNLTKNKKLSLYEKHFNNASKSILRYLDISESEYEIIKGNNSNPTMNKGDSNVNDSSKEETNTTKNKDESTSLMSRCQLVLSSRSKPIEELPTVPLNKSENPPKSPRSTPKAKPRSKTKLLKGKQNSETNSSKEETNTTKNEDESTSLMSRCQLVLSSRSKPIEELPTVPLNKSENPPKSPRFTPKVKPIAKTKLLKGKQNSETNEIEITDYLKEGEILYPKLIKDEINKFDKEMLVYAKKANSIGGTTLVLAILDAGQLMVGNVGDSRAVFGNDCGIAVPMSYDHKPCQLKEKKRIQEAGGFVAMNGVWRVMGVLATSRALGDYPLKDKKVVVSDPDVLSFSLKDHRMEFAVLASDGLWDTHSNEEAVARIRARLGKDRLMGAETLAREAFSRGSLDNITVLVVDLRRFKK
eukprot:GFUD01042033.1.p1 GENE.GFUD01042033.1~~GFUD01042033.1.p1  ORF type:complete len:597 (+),score=180.25 GFUD01042033.1:155-1945(+)